MKTFIDFIEEAVTKPKKPIDQKMLNPVEYAPGTDPLINGNAAKRRKDNAAGNTGESYVPEGTKADRSMMAYVEKRAVRAAEKENVGAMSRADKEAWIDKHIKDNAIPKGAMGSAVYSGVMKVRPMKESIGHAGHTLTIEKDGKTTHVHKLPSDAKAHHITQELRKSHSSLGDSELMSASRNLASKGVHKSGSITMTMKKSTPKVMEAIDPNQVKADRDEKRKAGPGEYHVTNHEGKKTHKEPFKTSAEAIRHADKEETKTGRVHTVHHVKNGKIQKQWQYSDSHRGFAAYGDHRGSKPSFQESVEQIDEILSVAGRIKRGRDLKKNKAKLKMGKIRQSHRIASKERLQDRAKRHARDALVKRITKGIPKGELSMQRRAEIERRLDRMKTVQTVIARKLLPQVRKDELMKKRGDKSSPNAPEKK